MLFHLRPRALSIYFIGIGGIGMSALARYYKAKKWDVSGSDLAETPITRSLRKEGIRVKIGHTAANIKKDTGIGVYNRAITSANPELLAAKKLGVPVFPYAEVLGSLTERYKTIAITGSHGKSTTTALAGLLLTRAGLDPTVFIGTNLKEFGGKNLRIGHTPYLVLEADDFGAAFLAYSPTISIITNVDREHLDFYKSFANLKKAFLEFLSRTKRNGAFILNQDDKELFSLRGRIAAIAKKKNITTAWYSMKSRHAAKVKKMMSIPGAHNVSNALAAYCLGRLLHIPERKILSSLAA